MAEKIICLNQDGLPEPITCRQDANMQMLTAAVVELKDGQKEVISLIRESVENRTEIKNLTTALTEEVKDRKHVNDILFDRVHDLEQAPKLTANSRQSGLWGALVAAIVAIFLLLAGKQH